ncbi:PH domain-like [Phytophthora cactorum]|nr:PH domain-like [Phytophthora cactorum]
MPSAPDYCGWGAKQGSKVRTWKNRYFVLHGRELVYYSGAKSDGSGTGVGEKGRLKVVNVDYSPDRKNGLFIHGEGKDLKMTTASAQESRVLFRKIKEVIGEQETSFRMSTPQTQQKMIKKTVEKEGWLLKEEPQLQAWKRSYVMLSGRTVKFCAHRNAAPVDSLTLMKVEQMRLVHCRWDSLQEEESGSCGGGDQRRDRRLGSSSCGSNWTTAGTASSDENPRRTWESRNDGE